MNIVSVVFNFAAQWFIPCQLLRSHPHSPWCIRFCCHPPSGPNPALHPASERENTEHHRYRERNTQTQRQKRAEVCVAPQEELRAGSRLVLSWASLSVERKKTNSWLNKLIDKHMNDWTRGWRFSCLASNAGPLKSHLLRWRRLLNVLERTNNRVNKQTNTCIKKWMTNLLAHIGNV